MNDCPGERGKRFGRGFKDYFKRSAQSAQKTEAGTQVGGTGRGMRDGGAQENRRNELPGRSGGGLNANRDRQRTAGNVFGQKHRIAI